MKILYAFCSLAILIVLFLDKPVKRSFPSNQSIGFFHFPGPTRIAKIPTPGKGVILLNFNGFKPKQLAWSEYDILSPSTLTDSAKKEIICRVANYYSDYKVIVTTDSKLFYTYPVDKRVRVTITDDNISAYYNYFGLQVKQLAPAFSRYNALFLGDTVTALVSSKFLENNIHDIADGTTHEIGHMIGLAHQSRWVGTEKIDEYNSGDSLFAPLMGSTYTAKKSGWTIGINSFGQYQDDTAIIAKTWTRKKK